MKRVLRYTVPVDDCWHAIDLSGPIRHIATRGLDYVEIWAETGGMSQSRRFRVYGTGHLIPDDATYVGTVLTPGGQLVWHLYEASES